MSAISAFTGIANCLVPPVQRIKKICLTINSVITMIANKIIALIGALFKKDITIEETILLENFLQNTKDGTDNPNQSSLDAPRGFNITINGSSLSKNADRFLSVYETIKNNTSIPEKQALIFEQCSNQGIIGDLLNWLNRRTTTQESGTITSLSNQNPAYENPNSSNNLLDITIKAKETEQTIHHKAARIGTTENPFVLQITKNSNMISFSVRDFSMLIDLIKKTVHVRLVYEKKPFTSLDTKQ